MVEIKDPRFKVGRCVSRCYECGAGTVSDGAHAVLVHHDGCPSLTRPKSDFESYISRVDKERGVITVFTKPRTGK